jgi:hypothetical protein
MGTRDLLRVGANECAVANDVVATDDQPIDTMRP